MNKQEKIGKVMKEFKEGTLKTSAGKKVKSRKQAVAIAMSESEGYAEKADLISQIKIDSLQEAEDILKAAGTEDLFEKAKYQVGEMHPNGKWVWTEYAPGKFDWRSKGGRTHTKHSAGSNAGTGSTTTTTQQKPSVKQIVNERKKPTVGDVSKLTTQQKSMVDMVMDKGFLMTSNKYNDKSKVELKKTPKGNWRCYYEGKDIGTTINGKLISDTAAKKIGWYKEETKSIATESADTTQAKPKKRPIGVGTNGPEKRKNESTGVDTLKYESKNGFKFKKGGHYKMRYNQREKAYEIWEQGDIHGIKTAKMQIKSENENIGMDIIKHMKEKYSKGGSGSITYSNTTYAF